MEFKIKAEVFMAAIAPVAHIAIKNVQKVKASDGAEYYHYDNILSITANPEELIINTRGDSSSIVVRLRECEGYIFEATGVITVRAKELMSVLVSFYSADNLSVSVEDRDFKITLSADKEVCISVPGIPDYVPLPLFPKDYYQQVMVDKAYFIKGMEKVAYAQASNKDMFSYMCILFEACKDKIRFSAGSGGHFAVVEYGGQAKKIASDEMKAVFPKVNVSNIIHIFKKTACSTLKITTYDADRAIPDQIVLEADNIVFCIYGLEHLTKYPDLSSIISYDYTYQISTRMQDWAKIAESITASKHFHEPKTIATTVIADLMHGHFSITTDTQMKMNRKVDFEMGVFVSNSNKDKSHQPWFCCDSNYVKEMVKRDNKGDVVVVNFDDQSILDDIPADKPKQMKPVLLRFPEKTYKDGITEKSVVFFTVKIKR